MTFATGLGLDVAHAVESVVDDSSLISGHWVKLDVNVSLDDFTSGLLGNPLETIVFVFFVSADIKENPVSVTELVANSKSCELIESLECTSTFSDEDWVSLGVDVDVDDVLIDVVLRYSSAKAAASSIS